MDVGRDACARGRKGLGALVLITSVCGTTPGAAQTSWDEAIDTVRAKSSAYYDYAFALDPLSYPGTALQGIGHDRHICAIAGRMLGFREEIFEAETFDDPPMLPDTNPSELMAHSFFLDAWVAAAERAVSMTDNQRASLWNLECVGRHGIPLSAVMTDPSISGDFSVLGDKLVVYGNIDDGFFERFVAALDANPTVDTVALGSAGGNVRDAIMSGMEVRARRMNTELHGPCYSACPLIFSGGIERIIYHGLGPFLGFHQASDEAGAVSMSDPLYTAIADYFVLMGIDPYTPLTWMASAGPESIYEPTRDEMCESGIVTWIQRWC